MNWSNFELPGRARGVVGGSALVSMVGIVLSQTLLAASFRWPIRAHRRCVTEP